MQDNMWRMSFRLINDQNPRTPRRHRRPDRASVIQSRKSGGRVHGKENRKRARRKLALNQAVVSRWMGEISEKRS